MGQAGVQREPSMEEILASIRRIIENNETDRAPEPQSAGDTGTDPAAGAAATGGMPATSAGATRPEPVVEPSEPDESEIVGTPVEPRGEDMPKAEPAPQAEREPATPVSLADVAARIRTEPPAPVGTVVDDAAIAELQDMFADEAVTLGASDGDLQDPAEGLQAVARAMAAKAAPGEPHEAAYRQDPATGEESRAAAAQARPEAKSAPARAGMPDGEDDAAPAPSQGTASAGGEVRAGGSLISVDAGARVAASFEALDAALAAGSVRSFDQIAEELLRPMLQAWLDDNLPTLVERLVREEIERVARGPRR